MKRPMVPQSTSPCASFRTSGYLSRSLGTAFWEAEAVLSGLSATRMVTKTSGPVASWPTASQETERHGRYWLMSSFASRRLIKLSTLGLPTSGATPNASFMSSVALA